MKFEVLKKSHLKRNIIVGVVVVVVIAAIVLQFTKAKYRVAQSMPLYNATVNYSLADLNIVAVYLQDESVSDGYAKADTIPTSGYAFNESMSYCTVDGARDDSITISYDASTQMLTVSPMTTKGTKCYLYFDEALARTLLAETILASNTIQTTTPNFSYTNDGITEIIYNGYLIQDAYSFETQDFNATPTAFYTIRNIDGKDGFDRTGYLFDESILTSSVGVGEWNGEMCTFEGEEVYSYFTFDVINDESECKNVYSDGYYFGGYVSFYEYESAGEPTKIPATNGLYTAQDDDGTTYYYRGDVDNNWVSFAGFYWRIIRINGDGTLRLIYQGTSANTTGEGTQIGTSVFNSNNGDNMYVGYMYTSGEVHGLGTSSTIKGVLDTWYSNNLASYASYIDTNAGFCGDRTPYSGSGTGTTETYYAAYNRLRTNKTPTFSCSNSSDLYTTSSSNKGNKALTNPIGLITADEVAYAGGVLGTENNSYYLYTNQDYWTMSPFHFYDGIARVFRVTSDSYFSNGTLGYADGVRPVINLKADVTISGGDGTSLSPYVVESY